jgi:hypothetical protein
MSLQLSGPEFSSYTMKALIALYGNETPFGFPILDPDHPENTAEPGSALADRQIPVARRWRDDGVRKPAHSSSIPSRSTPVR